MSKEEAAMMIWNLHDTIAAVTEEDGRIRQALRDIAKELSLNK